MNNEPFSVVDPGNPDLVVSGWNDYCSDWMGLGFSTDGGQSWTNSLVPGYPADTSTEGMQSPEYIRTNNASDPLGAFDTHGHFYFGAISYNGNAGPKTNADVVGGSLRRHRRRRATRSTTSGPRGSGKGTPSANFLGKFLDKPMLEVDRTGGRYDGNVYMCFTKFPGERAEHDLLLGLDRTAGAASPSRSGSAAATRRRAATSPSSTTATSS